MATLFRDITLSRIVFPRGITVYMVNFSTLDSKQSALFCHGSI